MKKKYISLLTIAGVLTITTGVSLGITLSSNKNNTQTSNTTTFNNANYYNSNGFLLSTPSSVVTIGNITYSLNTSNNTATIINTSNNLGNFKVPGIIQNNNTFYTVNAIGQGACYNKQITSLTLPNTIKSIAADAFANNLLTTLTLPPYLTSLGNNAFSNNPFKSGTVIILPTNCSWNKDAILAPFNNNNNMGNFARCVKYIIQNLAVYGYVYGANRWQIVSWMPQVANLFANAVTSNNNIFNTVDNSNTVAQRKTSSSFSPEIPFLGNASLLDTAIVSYSGNDVYQAYGFNTQSNSNNLTFYWKNPSYNDNGQFTLNLYNPDTLQELYSNNNTYTKNSLLINYGDVIGIKDTIGNSIWNSGGNCVLSNGLPADEINGSTLGECGFSLGFKDSYLSQHNEMNYYEITQDGLIPYQNVLHVNINCLQDTSNTFNLTGTALANHVVTVLINNQLYECLSNSDGYFSIPITTSSPLTLGTKVQVSCEGCLAYNGYLLGANPINSGLLFQFNNANFGILPDGYTGTYQLWNNSNSTMPYFNNPYTSSNNTGYNPNANITIPSGGAFQMTLTDTYTNAQGKLVSSSININYQTANENCTSQLEQQLQNLKFNPNFTNTLTLAINPLAIQPLYKVISNGICIPNNITENNGLMNYTFTVTQNSFYAPGADSYTEGSSIGTGANGRADTWGARNFCLVSNCPYIGYGQYEDDYNKANFYDPTPAMWQKVSEITARCESTYEKVLAINEWVTKNMVYTSSYSYGHTIAQTFNHLEGECGNYADLAAVMCMMAGLVSRIIVGNCESSANYFSSSNTNHAWMQVWDEQLGGWITLDPTWGIFGPYGTVQDTFNIFRSNELVALVLWPQGTNYFSYFAGHSYAALLNLGNYFGYSGGELETFYPMQNAAYISQLLQETTTLTGTEADVVSY